MNILKGVGSNSCIVMVDLGCRCALLYLKSDVLVEIWVQKHNKCGIMDGIGAECMLHLQDKLLWTYRRVQNATFVFFMPRRGSLEHFYAWQSVETKRKKEMNKHLFLCV